MSWTEWIGIWIGGIVLFNLWEAYVGFGFKFPRLEDGPNAAFASVFWPVSLPICMLVAFSVKMEQVKDRRLERESAKERIRIAAKEDEELLIKQIERELQHVETEDQNTTRYAKIVGTSSSSYSGRGK